MQAQQEKDYTQKFELSLWKKLLHYAPRYVKHLIALAVFMAVSALIDVAFPLMTSYAIDRLIAGNADAPLHVMGHVVEGLARLLGVTNMTAFIIVYALLVCCSVATIYAFLQNWNEYMFASVLIRSDDKKTLTFGISSMADAYRIQWNYLMSASIIASVPTMLIFVFLQKQLIAGMTAGAVKE